ncbi:hypothetical protein D3Z50_22255 [Clostridiaceae bacterium]|nr:hypothetical protein [Clostridiaceae bacterium]
MVIRFHIPGGEMAVEAAVFFREAHRSQIRRMLKMYRESGSGGGEYGELARWLSETAAGVQGEIRALQEDYTAARRRVSENGSLKEGRREASRFGNVSREIKREMGRLGKLLVRYREILKDVEKILGAG